MGKLELQQVLDMAIAEEMAAHCLYLELAQKVIEKAVRDTLLFLAKEELSHRDLLVAYREGRLAGQGLGMGEPVDAHLVEAMGTPEWDPAWGLKELFLAAARKEQISHEFYAELASRHPMGASRSSCSGWPKRNWGTKSGWSIFMPTPLFRRRTVGERSRRADTEEVTSDGQNLGGVSYRFCRLEGAFESSSPWLWNERK